MSLHEIVDKTPQRDEFSDLAVRQFFETQGRSFDRARRELTDLQSRYALARAKLADGYRIRAAELVHEAREAMRKLDAEQAANEANAARILAALEAARNG